MQPVTRLALVGAGGRMGRVADEFLGMRPDMEVVARIHSNQDLAKALTASDARVALDFTRAGLGATHASIMLHAGVHAVIGTSGVDPREDASLDQLAKKMGLGCFIVPNFSLGSCLQQRAAREMARWFPSATILEEHHPAKADAPSGTALETARQMQEARDSDQSPIGIHSQRLAGVLANQTIVLSGRGEVLRIIHETYDRDAYGPGMALAVQRVQCRVGLGRGLENELFAQDSQLGM